jgi:hypothetical protein
MQPSLMDDTSGLLSPVIVYQVGEAGVRQNLDGEDFLNSVFEFQKGDRSARHSCGWI